MTSEGPAIRAVLPAPDTRPPSRAKPRESRLRALDGLVLRVPRVPAAARLLGSGDHRDGRVRAAGGGAYKTVGPSDALLHLTMLQQPLGVDRVLGVCWTLWAEVRFYALFALFIVLPGANRQRVILFCAGWTLAAAIAQTANEPLLNTVLMPEYAPYFIGGVGLYLLHRNRRDAYAWGIVGVSWLIGQLYAVDRLWHAPNPEFFSYRSSYGIILVVTLGYLAVGAIALGYLNWANWRWLTVAGALTYPFYLVHEHLGWVVIKAYHRTLHIPSYGALPLTVATMLLLAWLLNRYVENRLTPKLRAALAKPRA